MKIDNIPAGQEDEFNEAMKEAQEDTNEALYTHTLKKPLEYNGKTYTEFSFDFEKLTGKDSLLVEDELQRQGIMVMVPTFNSTYLIKIAARACTETVGSDAFEAMGISDFNRLRNKVRNFLLTSEQ